MEAKRYVIVAVTILVSLGLVGTAKGVEDDERRSLAGLQGVELLVENMKPEVEQGGLTRADVQADVELRLRQAGIQVLTKAESFLTPGAPVLYVSISTMKEEDCAFYAFSVKLELRQWIRLDRNLSIIHGSATTWRAPGAVGVVGARNLRNVRENVRDEVGKFINDYLAANPKK
ncbi:MAG: hypothetical protein ACE5JQ_05730 [Candidatus Methylomirabilales bacterium]